VKWEELRDIPIAESKKDAFTFSVEEGYGRSRENCIAGGRHADGA